MHIKCQKLIITMSTILSCIVIDLILFENLTDSCRYVFVSSNSRSITLGVFYLYFNKVSCLVMKDLLFY